MVFFSKLKGMFNYYIIEYPKIRLEKFNSLCLGANPKANIFTKIRHAFGFIYNLIFYKCTLSDYFLFSFYTKSAAEKKTYASGFLNHEFAYYADDSDTIEKCADKAFMSELLKPYLGREYLVSDAMTFDEFRAFTSKNPDFLFKPVDGSRGRGIEKWHCTAENIDELFNTAKENPAILDELIVQHPDVSAVCPASVNTIRYYAYRKGEEIVTMGCVFRMGRGTACIDNYSTGGIAATIDPDTGRIIAPAEDIYAKRYDEHPYSHIKLVGYQIPLWDKVKELIQACTKDYPLNYVGWDVAVRENDCVIVEANPIGGFQAVQVAGAGGKRELMEELMEFAKAHPEYKRTL